MSMVVFMGKTYGNPYFRQSVLTSFEGIDDANAVVVLSVVEVLLARSHSVQAGMSGFGFLIRAR